MAGELLDILFFTLSKYPGDCIGMGWNRMEMRPFVFKGGGRGISGCGIETWHGGTRCEREGFLCTCVKWVMARCAIVLFRDLEVCLKNNAKASCLYLTIYVGVIFMCELRFGAKTMSVSNIA